MSALFCGWLCLIALTSCKTNNKDVTPTESIAETIGGDQTLPNNPGWVTRHGLTSAAYQAEFDKWTEKEYRLTYISGHQQATADGAFEAHYNAIWSKQSEPGPIWYAHHDFTAADYQAAIEKAEKSGFQPILVDAFNVGSTVLFTAIFEKATVEWVARHGLNSAEYQAEIDKRINEGYRIRHTSGYEVNSKAYYAIIFDKSPSPKWEARHGLTAQTYQEEFDTLIAQSYVPVVIDGFFVGGTEYFTAIWHKADTVYQAKHQVIRSAYQAVADDFYYEGYRPVAIDGYGDGNKVLYATSWKNDTWDLTELGKLNNVVEGFMNANGLPSISLAIVKDEKLVYAKAFGMADIEASEQATTSHRYRVASLSKALTGAAVSKLIESTSLTLNQQVFGTGGILSSFGADNVLADSDIRTITVQDLLEHTTGGWGANCGSGSPHEPIMFSNNNQTRDWIITNTISNVSLPSAPGSTFCYSNFGYAALEAVIEANNGGIAYVDYLKQNLATPSGATSLEVAGNTLQNKAPNEVKYYDFFDPYIWQITRMAGHGGWMSTPIDYLRVMTKLDKGNYRPDLLGQNGLDIFYNDSVIVGNDAWNGNNSVYLKGLVRNNDQGRWDHNGNFTGTIAEYLRYDDGFSIMLVINQRQPVGGTSNSPRPGLKGLATDIYNANIVFPGHDLF